MSAHFKNGNSVAGNSDWLASRRTGLTANRQLSATHFQRLNHAVDSEGPLRFLREEAIKLTKHDNFRRSRFAQAHLVFGGYTEFVFNIRCNVLHLVTSWGHVTIHDLQSKQGH